MGEFDIDQALREIARAYRTGDLEPGIDSLVFLDPSLTAAAINVSDMLQLNACVAEHEIGAAARAYNSVFVAPDRACGILAHVYTASWQAVPDLSPRHMVMDDFAAAEAVLGSADLAEQVDEMRPMAGISYLR
jgi:hypothetical protein